MAEASSNLWALADAARARRKPSHKPRRFRWVVDAIPCLALLFALAIAVLLPASLPNPARAALFAFGLAAILWSTTSLNAAYVALVAVLLLAVTGAVPQDKLFEALASDVVWLMFGAFVLGAAIQNTGLAARLTSIVASRARSVGQLFWAITTALLPMSFLIPSTSGRAAVAIPVFRSLSDAVGDRQVTRAMALLVPTVILVTTIATLIGAGSHLIANDLLERMTGRRISFVQWVVYGLPFGVAAGYLSCWAITRLFLRADQRQRPLLRLRVDRAPLSQAEKTTFGVTLAMVALWLTEPWHKLEIATVSVLGALVLASPFGGVIRWKDALKAVSWNLIVFVGAALVLGKALIETGAAGWIIEQLFQKSGLAGARTSLLVLLALSLISLTSHIYMTSHAARAAALIPPLLYLGEVLKLNPVAVMFIGTVGMNYCLTFPVSSKALLMFQDLDGETFHPADLLRLSAVLMPVHMGLIVVFYYAYWRWIGLSF
jgi:anion transporter